MTFDLKGTQRGRFAKLLDKDKKKSKVGNNSSETTSDREIDPKKKGSKKKYTRKEVKSDYDGSSSDSSSCSDTTESDSLSDDSEDRDDEISSNDSKGKKGKISDITLTNSNPGHTLLDGDFLEFTKGRPLPLNDRAKAIFHMSILNVS